MVNKKSQKKKFGIMLPLMILLISLVSALTFAQDGAAISLSVKYCHEKAPVEGSEFRIYQVSSSAFDESDLQLNETFKKYSVNLRCDNSEEWRNLAITLAGYVSRDGIEPIAAVKTDANGEACFSDSSEPLHGLYLVVGNANTEGNYLYTPEPLLVFLPTRGEGGAADGNVAVEVKYDKKEIKKTISLTAVKIWKSDNINTRPSEVAVQLLRDGRVYNKAVLNEDNNWRFTWNDLDGGSEWMIVEMNVPNGYNASVEQKDNVFVITNTYNVPHTTVPDKPHLPNTGMLQWPIPLLAVCGMIIFSIGYIKGRKCDDNE